MVEDGHICLQISPPATSAKRTIFTAGDKAPPYKLISNPTATDNPCRDRRPRLSEITRAINDRPYGVIYNRTTTDNPCRGRRSIFDSRRPAVPRNFACGENSLALRLVSTFARKSLPDLREAPPGRRPCRLSERPIPHDVSKMKNTHAIAGVFFILEAPPGIGPGIRVLQTRALPLGHGAVSVPAHYTAKRRICQDLFAIFFKFFSRRVAGSCLSHNMTSDQMV